MNNLSLHTDSFLDMYADDSTLCATGESVNDLDVNLNKDISNVKHWCHDNQMASNTDKTNGMLITTYQKEILLGKNERTAYHDNTLLENVHSVKLLGFHVYKYLTWKVHVTKTSKIISSNIALLRLRWFSYFHRWVPSSVY